jgi:two-component system cell cycle sensor histidine kinase/response regulator CckA
MYEGKGRRTVDVENLDAEAAASLLRAIFQTGQDAMGVSRRGVIEIVNPALVALFGYEHESELIGRMVLDLLTSESRREIAEVMRQREQGLPVPGAYLARAQRRDGSEFDVDIRSTVYQLQGESYGLAILRDVSLERAAERVHREGQELYRAMFEVNSAIKLLIDPSTGQIIDANPAATRFYGWPIETLRSMRITDINTLSPAEVAAELEYARTRRRGYFRFRHRTASGELRHVEVHSGPIEVDGRELLFSILHDVTERDALEERLRQAQRLESIGKLAGGIAHDFNNLLTVMMGCCQLLEPTVAGDANASAILRDLGTTAQRAGDLTRQLLAFSRRQLLKPRLLQLNDVVTALSGLLQRSVAASIELVLALDVGLPLVRADPGQVDQVIMNLALNARDAMPNGGVLTFRTSRRTIDAQAGIDLLVPGEYVCLTVTDTGVGMDDATLGRVFEPFFTTKPPGQGTGLGLATAYGIVTQSGGQILASSTPGVGSEFTVLLPVSEEKELPEEPVQPPVTPRFSRVRTVLLVDDMDDLRRVLARQLTLAGFDVREADSAEAALLLGDSVLSQVDLLISDIVMPGTSGIGLAEVLLAKRPGLPTLLISGDIRNHDQSLLPAHVRFLQKPFGSAVLLREVEAMLAEHEAGEPATP